ncbi:MAG: nucleotidyltransferase domain-containing protein [Pseudomonadota bacterium]
MRHFGIVPWLFGSRLDDAARGGDIDLFIPGDWHAEESVPRRLRLCAELRRDLGDQKIDVVVEGGAFPATHLSRDIKHTFKWALDIIGNPC